MINFLLPPFLPAYVYQNLSYVGGGSISGYRWDPEGSNSLVAQKGNHAVGAIFNGFTADLQQIVQALAPAAVRTETVFMADINKHVVVFIRVD